MLKYVHVFTVMQSQTYVSHEATLYNFLLTLEMDVNIRFPLLDVDLIMSEEKFNKRVRIC